MRLLRQPSKRWLLCGLMLASLALMFLPVTFSRWICRAVQPVLAPLGVPGMRLTNHVRTRLKEIAGGRDPRQEQDLAAFLTTVRQQLENQQRTIDGLRMWRKVLGRFPCKLIDATVVGAEGVPLRNRRLLGAGRGRGVATGDLVTTRRLLHKMEVALPDALAVLGREYVVGRIVRPGAYTATLQLVTDPHFEMPAQLWRMLQPGSERVIYVQTKEGARVPDVVRHEGAAPGAYPIKQPIPALAQGDGRQIVLRQVPAAHGVREGDMVTTRELAELQLPFGVPIGRVTRTEPDRTDAHSVTVFAEPLADLATLRDVYIVFPTGT